VRDGVKGTFDGVEDEDLDGTANVVEVVFLSRIRSWIRASYVAAAFIISASVSLRGPLTSLSLTLSRRPW
jgi:hypothetical protein